MNGEEMEPASTRSNYERLREENIKRNEEFLKEIGINPTNHNHNHDISDHAPIKRTKSQPKKRAIEEVDDEEIYAEPKRRSSRLSKDHIVDDDEMPAAIVERRESFRPVKAEKKEQIEVKVDGDETVRLDISCADLRGYIATHNDEHSEEVSDEIIAHTLRRVDQMTNKQMANRIKVMTRLDKLLACYYALRAVGLVELCESTKNALRIRHKVEVPSAVEDDVFVSANGNGDAQMGDKEIDAEGDAPTEDHGEAEGKTSTDDQAEDKADAENKEEAFPATSPSSSSSQTLMRVTRTRSSRGRAQSPRGSTGPSGSRPRGRGRRSDCAGGWYAHRGGGGLCRSDGVPSRHRRALPRWGEAARTGAEGGVCRRILFRDSTMSHE